MANLYQRTVFRARPFLVVTTGQVNTAPNWVVQPSSSYNLYLGIQSNFAFGQVVDDQGNDFTATLRPVTVAVPPGCTLEVSGPYVTLHWDGVGAGVPQTVQVRARADDGLP